MVLRTFAGLAFVLAGSAASAQEVAKPMSDTGYAALQSDCVTIKDRFQAEAEERDAAATLLATEQQIEVRRSALKAMKIFLRRQSRHLGSLRERAEWIGAAGRKLGECDPDRVEWFDTNELPEDARTALGLN